MKQVSESECVTEDSLALFRCRGKPSLLFLLPGMWDQAWIFPEQRPIHLPILLTVIKGDSVSMLFYPC